MTPENKQRLQDAFNAAVNASPYADQAVPGIATREGREVTRRELVGGLLQDEQFYAQVDTLVASGKVTLDEVIEKFEAGMKKSISAGPRP